MHGPMNIKTKNISEVMRLQQHRSENFKILII
jgi:hypothetical protein